MNKKFLSAVLFGAIMMGAAGTFTSCSDYDDDIEKINSQLSDLKSQLNALQAKVDGGKYVTNVAKNGDGIVVTWSDNTTSTIETIKGDKGDKGESVVITIDETTGNWIIDGEDTGVCAKGEAGEKGEAGKNGVDAKSPSIDETTGNWVVYTWNAETEEYDAVDTGVSAKGASTYVVDMDNYYELHVATDKTGAETTTVKLPKNPTVLTEVEVLGLINAYGWYGETSLTTVDEMKYNRVWVTAAQAKAWNDLNGSKKLAKDQVLSTLDNTSLLIRVAPANVDASQFSFAMVNSQLAEAPLTLGTPAPFSGLLTKASSENGLWELALESDTFVDTYHYYDYSFKTDYNTPVLFALQEEGGFTTKYDLAFTLDETIELTASPKAINRTLIANPTPVNVGELNTVYFDAPQNVYDAYVEIDDATKMRWGITDVNGLSFKVGKLADNITLTTFPITVNYVTMDGETHQEVINIKPAKLLAGVTVLDAQNFVISSTASKNKKDYSLAKMFSDLGSNATLWKSDVASYEVDWKAFNAYGQSVAVPAEPSFTFDNTDLKKISKLTLDVNVAATTAFGLSNTYRAEITFKDAAGEVLNTVYVPFTLSIPALSEFLVKEQVVFGGTTTGKAYLNAEDTYYATGATYSAVRYEFKHAFKNFDNVANDLNLVFALDPYQKINNVAVGSLAKIGANGRSIVLTDTEKAYHQPINVNITSAKYLGIYSYSNDELAASAFALDVMSPLEQGNVVAANGTGITVVATAEGVAKVAENDFKATTYAGIAYKLFEYDGTKYTCKYLKNVEFESANENVFTVGDTVYATSKAAGYVVLTPANAGYEATEKLNVTVTDIWGYKKLSSVNVTVKPSNN